MGSIQTGESVDVQAPIPHALVVAWAVVQGAAICWASPSGITRPLHPWGRFEPGAWKITRVVTETFDEQGSLVSTTETRTTLVSVSQEGVTLRVEVLLEVGGRRFDAEPQTVTQGFHGELLSQPVRITELPGADVVISGRRIPCKVQQLEVANPTGTTRTKVYYTDQVEPYILRRESVKMDPAGKNVLSETTVEVIAQDVPCKVLGAIYSSSHVKSVTKHPKGTITTLTVMSMEVPGGVICQTSKELDSQGRLLRRSSLELVDYGLEPETLRPGFFFRRYFRPRKPFRFTPTPLPAPMPMP